MAAIQRLMELAPPPRLVEMADRVAGRFVIALLVLAVTAVAWWWIGRRALWIFVAVLVVAALSLATPYDRGDQCAGRPRRAGRAAMRSRP